MKSTVLTKQDNDEANDVSQDFNNNAFLRSKTVGGMNIAKLAFGSKKD